MKFERVVIEAIAGAWPDEVWTSEAIEERLADVYERLGLPEGRLELMTGIRERRFWAPGTRPSEASAEAGEAALNKSSVDRGQLDALIHAGVCRDRLEPATAAYVHGLLGLSGPTQIFDLSNACLGFLNGLLVAGSMIEAGQIRNALVVAGENGRPLVERTLERLRQPDLTRRSIKPYFANLTIGSGAAAAVVAPADAVDASRPRLGAAVVETDSSHNTLCEGDSAGEGLEMTTDSEELLVAGIGVAKRGWSRFLEASGWTAETPDRVVTHQVGRSHQRELFGALGLDRAKDFTTFEFLGNVGSVSCPATLAHAIDQGAFGPGDRLAMLGIGSGLSTLMIALEWTT